MIANRRHRRRNVRINALASGRSTAAAMASISAAEAAAGSRSGDARTSCLVRPRAQAGPAARFWTRVLAVERVSASSATRASRGSRGAAGLRDRPIPQSPVDGRPEVGPSGRRPRMGPSSRSRAHPPVDEPQQRVGDLRRRRRAARDTGVHREHVLDAPDDPELIQRFLPHLVSEAERLSRLVTDLLNLAQAEQRSESPDEMPRVPVNLPVVVRDVMRHLSDKAKQCEIALEYQAPSNPEIVICGDGAGIEQVVFNLVDNALSYTPAGGTVTISLQAPEEATNGNGEAPPTQFATLTVRDTGIGIPPEDVTRVFERFYRVDKARSRSQGGTGLGLAISKHIVDNHNGYIEVESEEGQGTTFRVLLPLGLP